MGTGLVAASAVNMVVGTAAVEEAEVQLLLQATQVVLLERGVVVAAARCLPTLVRRAAMVNGALSL